MLKHKVLITASSFGHICSFHLPYIEEFKKLGWEVHVAAGGQYKEIVCADKQFNLPIKKKYLAMANFKTQSILHHLMMEQNYDLVIAHTSLASFYTRMAEIGIKVHPWTINVVHGYLFNNDTKWIKAIILKTAEFLTAPMTDRIITMNQYDTQWAVKIFGVEKVSFVHGMGFNLDITSDVQIDSKSNVNRNFTLIYPAEFSKRKNQAMLIRSMTLLPEDIHLVLPGDGEKLSECKKLAKELGVDSRISFPGYVENIRNLLTAADIAVSSSHSEGLPFNLMEAMSCGLPIVASNVKGNSDLVRDSVNGFLYEYNDEQAFTCAILKLYENKKLLIEMGKASQRHSEMYKLHNLLPTVMGVYLESLH